MRLTLRTLLAYLDEILDPHDAEQLQRKIQDSEFATALVHQIRGSIRRIRLDAPALDAQGIGGDVNSVAEYLDNTLPPDQVPALEKVCLENEMHLGEVASCHQILTLVLGEAADVSDPMRHRAYAIAPTVAGATEETQAASMTSATGVADPPAAPAARPEAGPAPMTTKEIWRAESEQGLPEEESQPPATEGAKAAVAEAMPESQPATESADSPAKAPLASPASTNEHAPMPPTPKSRLEVQGGRPSALRSAMITLVIALLIVLGLMFASGQQPTFLAGIFGTGAPTDQQQAPTHRDDDGDPQAVADRGDAVLPEAESSDGAGNADDQQVASVPPNRFERVHQDAGTDSNSRTGEGAAAGVPSQEPLVDDEQPIVVEPARTDPSSDEDVTPIVGDAEAPGDGEPDVITPQVVDVDPPEQTLVPDVPPAPEANALANAAEASVPSVSPVAPLVDPEIDLQPADIAPPVASPNLTDTAASDTDQTDVPQPAMVPVSGPAKLRADQLLLTYDGANGDWQRAVSGTPLAVGHFLMGLPAFRADLEIGTVMRCSLIGATRLQLGPASDITIHDGRLLLKSRASRRSTGIRFQNDRYEIKLEEEGGLVAIEASHVHIPGTDVAELPHSVLRIHAITSDATVDVLGETHELSEGQHLVVVDNFPPRVDTQNKRPSWISLRSVSVDDRTAMRWKPQILEAEDVRAWLREQSHRRSNDASLAARCLAELDEFGPLVGSLQGPDQRSYWDQAFETLRRALTRGSQTVEKLQVELEAIYGAQAPFVMEMIRGYSDAQLAAGAAGKLVTHLDHPRLDYRVLAFQNLKSITGQTKSFRPESPIGKRRRPVDDWKKRLSQGHVRYPRSPAIVALLESFSQ